MSSNKQAPSSEELNELLGLYYAERFDQLEKIALLFTNKFPNHPFGWKALGIALKKNDKITDSLNASKKVLKLSPKDVEAYNNLGNTYRELGQLLESEKYLKQAIKLNPKFAPAYNNLGNTMKDLQNFEESISFYEKAINLKPDYIEAYNNLGVALKEVGKFEESEKYLKEAIKLNPKFAAAYNNLGVTLQLLGKLEQSETYLKQATNLNSNFSEAFYNLGNTLTELERLDESIDAHKNSLKINPSYTSAEVQMYNLMHLINDYSLESSLDDKSKKIGITTEVVQPFSILSWVDNPSDHLTRSQNWAKKKLNKNIKSNFIAPQKKPKRIKVGIFSADFNDHPIMYLITGLLREYDKEKIEIFIFSYGRKKSEKWQSYIKNNVDHFLEVSDFGDSEIVSLAKKKKIDIAIDLMGYTRYSRSNIFQFKIAPLQINYLGYAGTTGTNYMDYIVADSILIPDSHKKFFSEKIIYMPHTYLPTDYKKRNININIKRKEFKLPETAFVLCCFNNSYKISSREFDIWMRILRKKRNCVLWLIKSNKWSEENLYKEAKKRNVDTSRIIFAEKLSHNDHLNRHVLADLFIDTFNYNAHMTASDALWAGLPVITKQGKQFSSRVASSLLKACGLPELICENELEYEKLILEFIESPEKLKKVREKLKNNKIKEPLFDPKRYTRNFEKGLVLAYDNYFKGNKPKDIKILEK